ncbi:MAG: hypothetical protein C0473_02815 [Cyanobacteria bacterium DS3.002]|nr:hypothetical protein [Cyanobacteria bacterium DS3.002]
MNKTGYINSGIVQFFSNNVSDERRTDVLNSTLFAQKAVDAQVNRRENSLVWFTQYTSVLLPLGWAGNQWNIMDYQLNNNTKSLSAAVYEIMSEHLNSEERLSLNLAFSYLKNSPDATATKLLESESKSLYGGTFQISSVDQDIDGIVSMKVGAFFFSSSLSIPTTMLSTDLGASVKLAYSSQILTLNNEVYKTVRKSIEKKLGTKASNYLIALDVGQP